MAHHDLEFSRRVTRLSRKHRAMSRGFVTRMRPDGLLVTAPSRPRPRLSPRVIVLFVAAFFGFKAFILAAVGAAAYDERVARLEQGTWPEAAGAWVLQSDRVTEALAAQIRKALP